MSIEQSFRDDALQSLEGHEPTTVPLCFNASNVFQIHFILLLFPPYYILTRPNLKKNKKSFALIL